MLFHKEKITKKENLMCIQTWNEKKKKRIKTKLMDKLFEVFNTDETRNKKVTRYTTGNRN